MTTRRPVHPGKLVREFMGDDLSVTALARHLKITRANLSRVLNEHGGISADLALRLSESFGTTPDLWMNMQSNYDLWHARADRSTQHLPLITAHRRTVPRTELR